VFERDGQTYRAATLKKGKQMRNRARCGTLVSLIFATALAACSESGAEPGDVTFDLSLIEIKGSTEALAPPETDPVSLSLGYRFKAPGVFDANLPNKWEVSTYLFAPGAMSVVSGDTVTLRMFGVNGDEHVIWIEAPDGSVAVEAFTVNRGRQVEASFEATQVGHYTIMCTTHAPTMQADILSLAG
jgi:plastocyanin